MVVLTLSCIAGVLFLSACSSFDPFGRGGDRSRELVGPTWQLTSLRTQAGETRPVETLIGRPDTLLSYTLTFAADGQLGGVADCNRYGADYVVPAGGSLSVSSLYATEQHCGEGTGESLYVEGLAGAVAYEVDGEVLHIRSEGEGRLWFEHGAD